MRDYFDEEEDWESDPGFAETNVPMSEPIPYNRKELEQFVELFNNAKKTYSLVLDNCQEFVCELLAHLNIEQAWSRLGTIQSKMVKTAKWSAASSSSATRPAFEWIAKKLLLGVGDGRRLMKEAMKQINLVGHGPINLSQELLATEAGKEVAKQAGEQGRRLILSGTGEMI